MARLHSKAELYTGFDTVAISREPTPITPVTAGRAKSVWGESDRLHVEEVVAAPAQDESRNVYDAIWRWQQVAWNHAG